MAKVQWKSETLAHGIHAFTGGDGTPVVLLPGWPQTAEAYTEIFPLLSPHHHLLVLDPPGLGDSAPPSTSYDTQAISRTLEAAVRSSSVGDQTYHLVGHDVGAWIAYAWASQFPSKLLSLSLLDSSIPGLAAPLSYPLPAQVNQRLWQFSFNALPDLPEVLTQGRERELLDWLFDRKSAHPERITRVRRDRYVECYARPGGMAQGFEYYRAVAQSTAQTVEFAKETLKMPVLALGGKGAVGDMLRKSMATRADDVRGVEIEDCGHYVMEEQPEDVAAKLLEFFQYVEEKV